MASESADDVENPDLNLPDSSVPNEFDRFTKDPLFLVAPLSMLVNSVLLTNAVYGLTGRLKLARLIGNLSIPCSWLMCRMYARQDFKNWKRVAYKDEPVLNSLAKLSCKHDWTEYARRFNSY